MATETHIAGLDIHYDTSIQQRCAWCGAVLLSMDLTRVAFSINEGDDPDEARKPATWPVGALVRCHYDGTVARWGEVSLSRTIKEVIEAEPHPDYPGNSRLPDDACCRAMPLEDSE